MRKHGRRDGNHKDIVRALRFAKCSVVDLADVGGGVPDLLVGRSHRVTRLLEVKTPGESLTPDQKEFRSNWNGTPVVTVTSIEEALAAMGLTKNEQLSKEKPC